MSQGSTMALEELKFTCDQKRVLSLSFTHRGFGFTIFDDPNHALDWGHCYIFDHDPQLLEQKLTDLIKTNKIRMVLSYCPNGRIERISKAIGITEAVVRKFKVRFVALKKDDISDVFQSFGSYTKYQRAGIVASHLPELSYKLPRKRRFWQSEDIRLSIFDSACLALAYYYLN